MTCSRRSLVKTIDDLRADYAVAEENAREWIENHECDEMQTSQYYEAIGLKAKEQG